MKILYVSKYWGSHNKRIIKKLSSIKAISLTVHIVGEDVSHSIPTGVKILEEDDNRKFDILQFGPVDIDIEGFYKRWDVSFRKLVCMPWMKEFLYDDNNVPLDPASPNVSNICKKNIESSDALWLDCDFMRNYIYENITRKNTMTLVLPWGIDLDFWTNFSNNKKNDRITFASVRAWEGPYNIPTLLSSFEKLSRNYDNVHLILGSTGSLKGQVFKMIGDMKLRDKVSCPGLLTEEDVKSIYEQADIYVSSSLSDGSSISLLEAMSAGLPAIAHEGSGNIDWITDENGLLVDFRNSDEVTKAMEQMIDKRDMWLSMGSYSKGIVSKRADWSMAGRVLEEFYLGVDQYLGAKDGTVQSHTVGL